MIMEYQDRNYNPKTDARRRKVVGALGYALIVLLMLAIIMFSFFAFQGNQQYWCKINSGVSCGTLVFSSAKNESSAVIVGVNTKGYALLDPELALNTSMSGQVIGSCKPYFVLPGGTMTCSVTINTQRLRPGSLVNGYIQIKGVACPSGNPAKCNNPQTTIYTGTFNTHSSNLLTSVPENVKISTSNVYNFGDKEIGQVTANVSLLGYPVSGANVSFTSSNPQAVSFGSQLAPTNANGLVTTTFSAVRGSGTVMITASFGGYNASVPLNLSEPSTVAFKVDGVSDVNAYALTLDGQNLSTTELPASINAPSGSNITYSFAETIPYQKGIRYEYNSTSGCGQSQQSATLSVQSNCTVEASYKTQYLLSMYALPSTLNSPITLGSMWYNQGSQVTITETPSTGFTFTGWEGSGYGSYSGTDPTHNVLVNNPLSETALYQNSTSPTTTASTTTQTTTILTITVPPQSPGCPCTSGSSTTVSTTVATTSPTTSPTTGPTTTPTTSTVDTTTTETTNPTTASTVSSVSTTVATTSTESTMPPVTTRCIKVPAFGDNQCEQ